MGVLYLNGIRGTFHNNFPGFLGFIFFRKLARTKTQQGTDKASGHNRPTVFSRALIFRTYQQKWLKHCFILCLIFVLLPRNFRQLPFLPPPPPPLEHAAVILDRVSVPPDGTPSPPPSPPPLLSILHPIRFLCQVFLSGRRKTGPFFGAIRCRSSRVRTPS